MANRPRLECVDMLVSCLLLVVALAHDCTRLVKVYAMPLHLSSVPRQCYKVADCAACNLCLPLPLLEQVLLLSHCLTNLLLTLGWHCIATWVEFSVFVHNYASSRRMLAWCDVSVLHSVAHHLHFYTILTLYSSGAGASHAGHICQQVQRPESTQETEMEAGPGQCDTDHQSGK